MIDSSDFERTVICMALNAETFDIDIKDIELQEEWFTVPQHKLIVKHINRTKMTGLMDEFTVMASMESDGVLDSNVFLSILAQNPFHSPRQYMHFIWQIKRNSAKRFAV